MAEYCNYLIRAVRAQPLVRVNWVNDLSNVLTRLRRLEDYLGQPNSKWYMTDPNTGTRYGSPEESDYPHLRITYSGAPPRLYVRDRVDQLREMLGVNVFPWKYTPNKDDFDNAHPRCGIDARALIEIYEAIGHSVGSGRFAPLRFYEQVVTGTTNSIAFQCARDDGQFTLRTSCRGQRIKQIKGTKEKSQSYSREKWNDIYFDEDGLHDLTESLDPTYWECELIRGIVGINLNEVYDEDDVKLDWFETKNIDAIGVNWDTTRNTDSGVANTEGHSFYGNSYEATRRIYYGVDAFAYSQHDDRYPLNEKEGEWAWVEDKTIQNESDVVIAESLPDGTRVDGYTFYYLEFPMSIEELSSKLEEVHSRKYEPNKVKVENHWSSGDFDLDWNEMKSLAADGIQSAIDGGIYGPLIRGSTGVKLDVNAYCNAKIEGPSSVYSYYQGAVRGWLYWKESRIDDGWKNSLEE